MATLRSTRRRLLSGTGAAAALNYMLIVPGSAGRTVGPIYFDSSMNFVQHGDNAYAGGSAIDPNISNGPMLVDTLGQWYYIKTGALGSSQRTNCYGYIQTALSNMSQRFLMKYTTSLTEFQASGTTESWVGGSCALHPAGDVIMNYVSAGAGTLKSWTKVANDNWTYNTHSGLTAPTSMADVVYSPSGTQMAVSRQTGAQPYQIWRVDDRFGTYSIATCSFSAADQGSCCRFENDSRLIQGTNGSPWINYYGKTGALTWGTDGTILTDNPSGLVGTDLKNTIKGIWISPDATIMVTTVTTITAPGKSHHLFYKSSGKWVYQGQLPGNAAAASALINDVKWSQDGLFMFVAFANSGIQVWNCASGAVSYNKQLLMTDGLQNGCSMTASTNHKYFGVVTVGAWEDPAGRSEIDTQIELVAPTYWWKFNEQYNCTGGEDYHPVIRNFGSTKTGITAAGGNSSVNYTVNSAVATPRVSGPPSTTASFASRFLSGLDFSLTSNGTSYIDGPTSGTVGFFVKFTAATALFRQIFSDTGAMGVNGVHFGLFSGHIIVKMGTTGASARAQWTNNTFNDGNWHFVVVRQPANGTGCTISVDGTNQALTVNPAADGSTGVSTALTDFWFNSALIGATCFGQDTTATQFDLAHLFITNTQLTAPQEAAIKSAAGL